MKLTRLQIKNFVGIHNADIEFETPVTLIVGGNNQGKSSIRDAVLFALTGKCRAGTKWKDAKQLVNGAGRMGVKLEYLESDGSEHTAVRSPSTASIAVNDREILRCCLDPLHFVQLAPKERARILAEACGGNSAALAKAAIEKHVGKIDSGILASLKLLDIEFTDVDAFREGVVILRKDYKRAVATVKNETPTLERYGLPAAFNLEQSEAKVAELADRIQKGGDLLAGEKRRLQVAAGILDAQSAIKKLEGSLKPVPAEPSVSADEFKRIEVFVAALDVKKKGVAKTKCPLCDVVRDNEVLTKRRAALRKLMAEHWDARAEYDTALEGNAKLEADLQSQKDTLTKLEAEKVAKPLAPSGENLLADLTKERDEAQSYIGAYALFEAALTDNKVAQERNALREAAIVECNRIDACLKDGGPVKAAIADGGTDMPINKELLKVWGMEALGLSDIGDITLRGVQIETCSLSEQYRAACVIGMALAELSGIGVVALDEFGILSKKNKNAFMAVVEECKLNTVIMCATSPDEYCPTDIPDWLSIYKVKDGGVTGL